MPALAPRSIIFVLLVVAAGLAVQLAITAYRRRGDPALRWWTAAAGLGVVGIGMIITRGTIPDFVSIWLANVVISAVYLLLWAGLRVFDGRAVPWRAMSALFAGFALAFGAMYAEGAGLPARIVFISFYMATLCGLVVRDLLSDTSLPSRLFAAGLLGMQTTVFLSRGVFTLFQPPSADFMTYNAIQSVFLVTQTVFAPLWVVALIAMTGERAQARLAASLAEQLRVSDAKSQFLARLAHELRTPLNAVTGFADLIRESRSADDTRAHADRILTAAGHVVELSDELLDLARIESGKIAIATEEVDVASVLHEALAMLAGPYEARRMRVALHTPQPVRLSADARRLRQILLNVLGNAAKFGRDGGRVEIRLSADAAGARISVADDGPGIAAADPASLFEPFARGAGTGGVDGAGLGLPIVKGLMEAHGGTVHLTSEAGRGTTVELTFPPERTR
jgi:signal transduction histidine kinase